MKFKQRIRHEVKSLFPSQYKSRPRVKSLSNLHPLFTPNPLFIASKKWVIRINWSYLDTLFTRNLLFIVLEADFLLWVSSSTWIWWYIFRTHFTIFWAAHYNALEVTCMQTKMEIKSKTTQSTMVMTCTQKKADIIFCNKGA